MKLNTNGNFYPQFAKSQNYTPEMSACVIDAVNKLLSTETTDDRPGLLLGKVQSGKTRAFMGAITLAFDNGVDVAIVLTKGTLLLAEQTLSRINRDFGAFIDDRSLVANDIKSLKQKLTKFELNKKRVIVCMKEDDNVSMLIKYMTETNPELSRKSVLVIDDEADAASIGYSILDENVQMRKVPELIDKLRRKLGTVSFLQVTATPYSLYLQPKEIIIRKLRMKPMKPAFSVLVPVHNRYIGSEFYFNYDANVESVASKLFVPVDIEEFDVLSKRDLRRVDPDDLLKDEAVSKLRLAIINFIVAAAYRRLQLGKDEYYSMIIHADAGKSSHDWQVELVNGICTQLAEAQHKGLLIVDELLLPACEEMHRSGLVGEKQTYLKPPSAKELLAEARRALNEEWVSVVKVNSEKQVREVCNPKTGELFLTTPCTIYVGGQILDRGLTIGNILAFFYGRRPKKFQQSTVMQHSRMYGPRPMEDLVVTRFYTTYRVHQAMRQMHERDALLWRNVAENGGDIIFMAGDRSGTIVPCSPNQVILSNTTTIKPGKRLLPFGFQIDYDVRLRALTAQIDAILHEHGVRRPDSGKAAIDAANRLRPIRISVDKAVEVLGIIEKTMLWRDEDNQDLRFDWDGARAILRYLANKSHLEAKDRGVVGFVDVLIRWGRELNRNVSEKSHVRFNNAVYSYNESESYETEGSEFPTLNLIQQLGDKSSDPKVAKSWKGGPFWWPVIWCPKNAPSLIYGQEGHDGEG